MLNFHRKMLIMTATIREICSSFSENNDCDDLQPPPRTPPSLERHTLSPLKIFMMCSLVATFSFICYHAYTKICSKFRNRLSRTRNHVNITNETRQDFMDHDDGSVVFHPIWLINTVGLEQSVIDSIEVFKYVKKDGSTMMDASDCAVCLGEFQDDESLRILPKCSHAFHVTCIDTWLRSHKNCPVCRAPVVNDRVTNETSTQEEIPVVSFENEPIRVENALDIDMSGESSEKECLFSGVRVHSDLRDHHCGKVEPLRRAVSMNSMVGFVDNQESQEVVVPKKPSVEHKSAKSLGGSSSSIRIYTRAMKSSSFRCCSESRSFGIREDVISQSL